MGKCWEGMGKCRVGKWKCVGKCRGRCGGCGEPLVIIWNCNN